MRFPSRFLLIVAATLASTAANADFEAGRRAFNAGNFTVAAHEMRIEAERGNVNAMYILGQLYMTGRGVDKNDEEASKWYFRAAVRGDRNAVNDLFRMTDSGSVHAEFVLGVLYFEGRGVPRDLKASAGWMTRAAKQKHPLAAHYLGDMYLTGSGVEKNEATAVKWYTVAAEQTNPVSMAVLGGLYLKGRGVPIDRAEAFKWLFLAVGRFPQMAMPYQQQNQKIYADAQAALKALHREISDDEAAEGRRRAEAFVDSLKQRTEPPAFAVPPGG